MLDPDQWVLCEHGRETDECAICGGDEPERSIFDVRLWVERVKETAPRDLADLPSELTGVPLS